MADPLTEYQKVLASRGIGGVFQEEGPGMGPSAKTSAQIKALRQLRDGSVNSGMDERIATPQMNSGILEALRSDQRSKTVAPGDIESAINEVRGLNLGSILGSGLGSTPETRSPLTLQEKKARQDSRDTAASRIEAMPEDSSVFKDSSFFDIASQIGKAQIDPSLSGANDSEIAQRMIADKKRRLAEEESKAAKEAAALGVDSVIDKKMNKDAIAGLLGDSGSADKNVAVEDAFLGGMSEYYKALAQEVPEVGDRKELLKKYMQEFSEATGIPVGEKVDKSQALMAMGLSLMQNRAGKGFNVGKLLNAVGQAGDAAMPYLREATKEAKAAQLAAGRYALDKIAKGESATAAFNEEVRASADNWMLEKFKAANAIELEKIKAGGKANEMKNVASVPIGAGDLKVRIGDKDGVSVFASGPTDAGAIVNAYTKYTEGQENIDIMNDALSAIASKDSSALSTLADRAKSIGVAWGIVDGVDMFGPKGISDEAEFNKYRQATINAFKRLILQESQVSNLDLTTLFASFGEVEFMQNPKEAELAIDLMNQYFAAKKRSLEPVLTDFYDRSWFRSDEDYKRTQEKLSKLNKVFDPKVTSEAGERMTLDLSTIPTLKSE